MKKLIILLTSTLLLLGCQSGQYRNPSSSPSSKAAKKVFDISKAQAEMISEILQLDDQINKNKINLSTDVYTDRKNKDFFEKANKSIRGALQLTFKQYNALLERDKQADLAALLKKNIFKEFLHNYVLTIKMYKLTNMKIGFTIYFMKDQKNFKSFENEFNSNNIIHLDARHNFSKQILNPPTELSEQLLSSKSAGSNYLGGAVTVEVNVLDLNIRTLRKPLKGYIRYRRFFSLDDKTFPMDIKIGSKQIKSAEVYGQSILTVDVYKSFNSKELKPKLSHISYNFGQTPSHDNKTSTDGKLVLKNVNNKELYYVNSLSYSFKSNKFSSTESKISALFKNNRSTGKGRKHSTNFRAVKSLLKNRSELINKLQLDKYWSEL